MTDVTSQTDQASTTPRSWGSSSTGSIDLNGAADAGSEGVDGAPSVTVWLRRAAATVDRLWNEARGGADGELSMRLGEASHAIHRALLALQDPRSS